MDKQSCSFIFGDTLSGSFCPWLFLLCLLSSLQLAGTSQLTDGTLQLPTLAPPAENLTCFQCSTVDKGDNCFNVSRQHANVHIKQCNATQHFCQVQRISYLITAQAESFVPWSLERGCIEECKEFCVTMGARTKITYCTSCCNSTSCNIGNGAAEMLRSRTGSAAFIVQVSVSIVAFLAINDRRRGVS